MLCPLRKLRSCPSIGLAAVYTRSLCKASGTIAGQSKKGQRKNYRSSAIAYWGAGKAESRTLYNVAAALESGSVAFLHVGPNHDAMNSSCGRVWDRDSAMVRAWDLPLWFRRELRKRREPRLEAALFDKEFVVLRFQSNDRSGAADEPSVHTYVGAIWRRFGPSGRVLLLPGVSRGQRCSETSRHPVYSHR